MLSFAEFVKPDVENQLIEDRLADFIKDPKKKDDTDSDALKDAGKYYSSTVKRKGYGGENKDVGLYKSHEHFVDDMNKARYKPLSKEEAPDIKAKGAHVKHNERGVKVTEIKDHDAAQKLRDKSCGGGDFARGWCASAPKEKMGERHFAKYANQHLIQYRHPDTGEIHHVKYGFHVGARRHEMADSKNMPVDHKGLPPHVHRELQKVLPHGAIPNERQPGLLSRLTPRLPHSR